jgi:hypothetical protein
MKLIVRHPVWSSLVFEGLLALLFCFFPVGPCNQAAPGVVVVVLHIPAIFVVEHILGVEFSAWQLLLSAILMIPVWAIVLSLLHWLIDRKHGSAEDSQNIGVG